MASSRAVLIIGGSGFIGTHLALRLRAGFKVFATYNTKPQVIPGVTFLPVNVANRNWVKRVVYTAKPDVIVFAAGSNSLEWAEANPREAERIHTGGAATVSNVAEILQPKFIYLSNCYAFDGHRGNYRETDIILPSSQIGKAKVGGENFIRGKSLNYVIIRSSPLYGRGNGLRLSLLDRLRTRLDRGERTEVSTTEYHSFAPVSGLVDLIERLVDGGLKNKIIHFGGLTKTTHYDFARTFASRFDYDPSLIVVRRTQYHDKSKEMIEAHTFDFSLNSTHVTETLKLKPLLLEEGFDLLDQQLVARL